MERDLDPDPRLRFSRPVRLPLRVGVTAALNVARSATAALLLVATPFDALFLGGFGVPAIAVVLFYVVLSAATATLAWPTDLIIDAHGLRIEGGVDAPRTFPFGDLDAARCRIERHDESQRGLARTVGRVVGVLLFSMLSAVLVVPLAAIVAFVDRRLSVGKVRFLEDLAMGAMDEGKTQVHKLVLVRRAGEPVVLAEAERPVERVSLEAVLDTVRAAAKGRLDAPPPRPPHGALSILECAACGAPAIPDDRAEVECTRCGARVAVTTSLRERLSSVEQVDESRRRTEQLVSTLLEQPGAANAGRRLRTAAAAMHFPWIGVLAAKLWLWWQERLDWRNSVLLAVSAAATILLAYACARLALVDRQALRLVTVTLGARPPERHQEPYACRVCGAPLQSRSSTLLARCIYCQAENILGIDLRRHVAPVQEQRMTLEAVLRSRARERSIWRSSGAVVLCLFFLGLYAGYEGFVYRTALTAESARCWHGDLEACIEQGDRYEKGRGVAKDRERARALFRRACDRASVEGCFRRAAAEQVLSDDADDRLAADLYRKACDGGHAEACRKLKNR